MAARPQLPGMRWFLWMRIASLRIGILTGIYLSIVFMAWLIVANRVPSLERFAETRNLIGGSAACHHAGNPRAAFPAEARQIVHRGTGGLDASDSHLSCRGITFQPARKPHGGFPRFHAGRGFLRLRGRARLGVPDLRGSSPRAPGASPGNHVLPRQAQDDALISQISHKGKSRR